MLSDFAINLTFSVYPVYMQFLFFRTRLIANRRELVHKLLLLKVPHYTDNFLTAKNAKNLREERKEKLALSSQTTHTTCPYSLILHISIKE
jgi:hypothetical protein